MDEHILRVCSIGSLSMYCCEGDAWDNVHKTGTMGFYVYGAPLPQKVIDVSPLYGIDPHDLDWHVEAVHGWEFHDQGYDDQVLAIAECMMDAGYGTTGDKEKCRPE